MEEKSSNLIKVSTVLSKIIEIANWIFAACLIVGLIVFISNGIVPVISGETASESIGIYGYDVQIADASGALIPGSIVPLFICAFLVACLTAMIFRDIYLICKFTQGKGRYSEGKTPFQPDNTRMVKEIGIFAITIPIVQLVCDVIIRLATSFTIETSGINVEAFVLGIAMLCLSQVFAYGTQLQADTDGLI